MQWSDDDFVKIESAFDDLFNELGMEKMIYTTAIISFLSGLPDNNIYSLAIDGSGNKWIGPLGGVAEFDGSNWTVYNTSNSGLPDNNIFSLAIDGSGNKWIGTYEGGLAVYNEGGVVTGVNNITTKLPNDFSLAQNYPNPFNPSTTIKFALPTESIVNLEVFNILGEKIAVLIDNKIMANGYHDVTFNSTLASGVYIYRIVASSTSTSEKFVRNKKMILLK